MNAHYPTIRPMTVREYVKQMMTGKA